jgi:hypothetical protein
LKERRQGEL